MEDRNTKNARNYWNAWKRHYKATCKDEKKMIEAIRRLIVKSNKEGMRQERGRQERIEFYRWKQSQ